MKVRKWKERVEREKSIFSVLHFSSLCSALISQPLSSLIKGCSGIYFLDPEPHPFIPAHNCFLLSTRTSFCSDLNHLNSSCADVFKPLLNPKPLEKGGNKRGHHVLSPFRRLVCPRIPLFIHFSPRTYDPLVHCSMRSKGCRGDVSLSTVHEQLRNSTQSSSYFSPHKHG
jgi:hypothetical protein